MADKKWAERRPGYHSYFSVDDPAVMYGDVRAVNFDPSSPCSYVGLVYTPPPYGMKLGAHPALEDAKLAVEQECIRQSL